MKLEDLKKLILQARKDKEPIKVKAYQAVQNHITMARTAKKSKGLSVIDACQKELKIIKAELEPEDPKHIPKQDRVDELTIMKEALTALVPSKLNAEETRTLLTEFIGASGIDNLKKAKGQIMKFCRDRGDIDMGLANQVLVSMES